MTRKIFLNEKFILILIVLNAIVIFIEGFHFEDTQYNFTLELFDNFFTVLFLMEMAIKINYLGYSKYFSSNWNIFDFILIIIAIPSLISLLLHISLPDLAFLLALRTLRIFKFLRVIRFLPGVSKILNGAYRAAKSSIIIIISFIILNFVISLISCFMFRDLSAENFGDPLTSFYSIFQVFTIEGWYEIPDSIIENMESKVMIFFTRLYFIIVLFVGGIFGLSLVNSVFVDSMIADNNSELEKKLDNLNDKVSYLIKQTDRIENNKKN
jgi:voltage-gated sodium channel